MVLSVKSAAVASYYFQEWGVDEAPVTSRGVWLRRPRGLGFSWQKERDGNIPVDVEELKRLLHRQHVASGEMPTFNRKARSSGHDFVFSVPKSVSVLWALNPEWRRPIELAHEAAVRSAAEILLDHAIRERVGKGGRVLAKAEAAAAVFFHYKSRPARHPQMSGDAEAAIFADPNLHTHVVVPDLVVGSSDPAKRRLKVVYTALYGRWAMALGAWYHARLAHELRRCGLEPKARGSNGLFELDIFEPFVVPAFSARTEGARNLTVERDLARSLQATRRKAASFARAENEQAWRRLEARLFENKGRIYQGGSAPVPVPRDPSALKSPAKSLHAAPPSSFLKSVIDDLTSRDAVLQLPDLFRGVACRLVADSLDLPPGADLIEALASRNDVIALAPSTSYGFAQWTSRTNLNEEAEVVQIASRLRDQFFPKVKLAPESRRGFPWTARQWQVAEALAGMERLLVLTGPPGSGKSKILEPVVRAYKAACKRVIVAAEAWQTALEVGKKCEARESYALAMLFEKYRRGRLTIDDNTVLMVDEAGLLSTRRMLQVLRLAEDCKCKLILLGDVAQLSPIGAGSGLSLLKKAIAPLELTEICRSRSEEQGKIVGALHCATTFSDPATPDYEPAYERMALEDLAKAIAESGAWESYPTSEGAVARVAQAVVGANSGQDARIVALARSHREAQHITRIARQLRLNRGDLRGPEFSLKAVTPMGASHRLVLAEGDFIRFQTRAAHLDVVNGTQAVITRIEGSPGAPPQRIHVRIRDGRPPALSPVFSFEPTVFYDAEQRVRIACDYASTIFGSQGATYEDVVILRSARMTFREMYVALTRASKRATIVEVDARRAGYLSFEPSRDDIAGLPRRFMESLARELFGAKRRDRATSLAIDLRFPVRSNRPSRRAEWLWDAVVLEDQAHVAWPTDEGVLNAV